MPITLLLSPSSLQAELGKTLLWRNNMERLLARSMEEARRLAAARRPDLIIVDEQLPEAVDAVTRFRQDGHTRSVSIVALARGDFDSSEFALLQAGVNGILRLPPGPDWEDRLVRLIHVPSRKEARLPVRLLLEDSYAGRRALIGSTHNLSVNGLLIESTQPLAMGEEVHFAFNLPDSWGSVAGVGTVVRKADGAGLFGVEVNEMEGDGRQLIKRFVEANSH